MTLKLTVEALASDVSGFAAGNLRADVTRLAQAINSGDQAMINEVHNTIYIRPLSVQAGNEPLSPVLDRSAK